MKGSITIYCASTAVPHPYSGEQVIQQRPEGVGLPAWSSMVAPELIEGYWPCMTDDYSWTQIENHVGLKGYVNGEPFTITELGPYPSGWSTTPPEPTDEEKYYAERAAVDVKYSSPWNGTTGGILTMLQMTMSAAQCEVPQNSEKIAGIGTEYQAELAAMRAELQAIDEKYGV